MEPSDFRYDPYNDIPTGVEITERHIIPANSPYHIRLNEVPQKESPSTITIKEITNISTSVTYGKTFSEVAANPAAGEFWPDCNTGANGDENWNTGLITFNAADAGKIIEVSYTGTGTLAAVNSNHWPSWYTDRGDGSDGDFVPTENTTISGVKNYKSVFIKSGLTITVDKYVLIKCQGAFINNGTITANGKGATGGTGVISAENYSGVYGNKGSAGQTASGGAGGKAGSSGNNSKYTGGAGGYLLYNNVSVSSVVASGLIKNNPDIYCGAGGGSGGCYSTEATSGAGGAGGGCIRITSGSFNNKGTITANGNSGGKALTGAGAGGGGGGGCVTVLCKTLTSEGTITVNGGSGGAAAGSATYHGTAGASGEAGVKFVKSLGV